MEVVVQQVMNALALGGTYALLALGLSLVFSIMRLVNFAHGELLTITGYALFFLGAAGAPFPLMALGGVLIGALAAVAMERVAFRPFRGASGSTLLLTSFAVAVIIQLSFQNFVDPRGRSVPIPEWLRGATSIFGFRVGVVQLVSFLITAIVLVLLTMFLRRTRLGLAVRAAAQDFDTTRLMGIRAQAVTATVFAMSGILAGIAGVLWVTQRTTVDPFMGLTPVLKAFIAVIVGGMGSLVGGVAAAFLLGFIEIMAQVFLPAQFQPLRDGIVWLIVIAVLLARPSGLFASGRELT
jgi:branched-chain amino acid transport system permease protein